MRVFIGLTEISGYCTRLNQGFKQIGVPTTFIDLGSRYHQYGGDDLPNALVRVTKYCASRQREAKAKGKRGRLFWLALEVLLRFPLLLWALWTHDVFIFMYKASFLFLYDLPILKLFGKKLIFTFVGTDVRPPYINGVIATDTQPATVRRAAKLAKNIKWEVGQIERYADVIGSHPLYAQFQTKPFVKLVYIGLPFSPQEAARRLSTTTREADGRIRILHSPSRPEAKGSPIIRAAVANLQAKGYPIDLIELTGVPNEVVLHELATCDFVFDQAYSDVFMSTFSTEAVFFGKAVIVAGYELEKLRDALPPGIMPPVLAVHPDAVEAAVEKLITDPDYRNQLGVQARQFVETHWTPERVARQYLRLIEGDIPPEWIQDGMDTPYIYGGGISEVRLRAFLRAYLDYGGRAALHLDAKPELAERLVQFSQE
jgi:hypothetical protein